MTREEFFEEKGITEEDFHAPEVKTEDVLMEMAADHEERICMIELFGGM